MVTTARSRRAKVFIGIGFLFTRTVAQSPYASVGPPLKTPRAAPARDGTTTAAPAFSARHAAAQPHLRPTRPRRLFQAQQQVQAAAEGIEDDAERLRRVYELVLSRKPRDDEFEMARDFLSGPEESGMSRLEQFAQVMLVCSEAIYVD